MSSIQAIILAFVQGISEFLPISSSGHLNLFQHYFGLKPSLSFDVFLNTASLLSVLFFFRAQVNYFFYNFKYILIASIPAGLAGILFKDKIEIIFSDISLLPYFFIITAIFLFATKFLTSKSNKLDYKKAIIIGLFQALAILPAVSRSGSTIFAALLIGLTPLEAFNFSFSLFIPASIGALILSVGDLKNLNILTSVNILSFLVTFVVGIIALTILKKVLTTGKFWYFGIYTFLLSITLFYIFYT